MMQRKTRKTKGNPAWRIDLSVATYPCMNCTKRHTGCHGSCKDFKEFQEKKKEKN